jgi:hypothetical protein
MQVKVIMSCDDNPYYLDFWPLVAKVWRERIGYEPVLVHVGDSEVTSEYGQVVNIKPLQDYKFILRPSWQDCGIPSLNLTYYGLLVILICFLYPEHIGNKVFMVIMSGVI